MAISRVKIVVFPSRTMLLSLKMFCLYNARLHAAVAYFGVYIPLGQGCKRDGTAKRVYNPRSEARYFKYARNGQGKCSPENLPFFIKGQYSS